MADAPAAAPAAAAPAAPAAAPARARASDFGSMVSDGSNAPHITLADPSIINRPTTRPVLEREPIDVQFENVDAKAQALALEVDPDQSYDQPQDDYSAETITDAELAALQEGWAKWKESEELPDLLMQRRVPVPATDDQGKPTGRMWMVPVKDLASGYLRESTFTRRMQYASEIVRSAEQTMAGANVLIRNLMTSPQTFLQAMQMLGAMPSFHGACELYAVEYMREQQLSPEARQARQQARAAMAHAARVQQLNQHLNQQLSQQAQVARPNQDDAYTLHQLEQYMPRVLKELNVQPSRLWQDAFDRHWNVRVQELVQQGGELTADFVRGVAIAAQEDTVAIVEQTRRYEQQNVRQLQAPPSPSQRVTATAAQVGAPNYANQSRQNGNTRARISDFRPGAR
jgi:hypothetical protein